MRAFLGTHGATWDDPQSGPAANYLGQPPIPIPTADPAYAAFLIINHERGKVGAPPLAYSDVIAHAAYDHSADMAMFRYMAHEGRDHSTFDARLRARGASFRTAGEVIGAGYPGYLAIVAGWMGSPSHRRIIMSPDFKQIGVAVVAARDGVPYWTADLTD